MSRERFTEGVRNHGLLLLRGLRVEVDPGDAPEPGCLHVDVHPGPHGEYVTSATALPFPDASVSHIYTRHCLEHVTRREGEQFVAECLRVLRPGGTIHIIVPNMAYHVAQFHRGDRDHACAAFWGWQRHEHELHKWGYWWETLSQLLLGAGFTQVQNLTGGPQSRERSDMHLEASAVKPAACVMTCAAPSVHVRSKPSVAAVSALIALEPQ
jgi:predicted SAM-dependent methyltransferase